MRIIKNNYKPSTSFRWTCKLCKSVMEATAVEAGPVREDRDGPYHQLKCPACGQENFIAPDPHWPLGKPCS